MIAESIVVVNNRTGEELALSVENADYILEYCDMDVANSTISYQSVYGGDGGVLGSKRVENRKPVVVGWLVGADDAEISDMRRKLFRVVNVKDTVTIKVNGYKISGEPMYSPKLGYQDSEINEVMCKFMFELLCIEVPFFTTETPDAYTCFYWDKSFVFPLDFVSGEICFGKKGSSRVFSAMNNGDVETGVDIKIEILGAVSNPKITMISTGEYIEVVYDLVEGDVITLSTDKKHIKARLLRSNTDINIVKYVADTSTYFQLSQGEHSFVYSAESGAANMLITMFVAPLIMEVR